MRSPLAHLAVNGVHRERVHISGVRVNDEGLVLAAPEAADVGVQVATWVAALVESKVAGAKGRKGSVPIDCLVCVIEDSLRGAWTLEEGAGSGAGPRVVAAAGISGVYEVKQGSPLLWT